MDNKEIDDLIYKLKVYQSTAENQIKITQDAALTYEGMEQERKLNNLLVFQRVMDISRKFGNDKAIEYVKKELEDMKNEYEKSI